MQSVNAVALVVLVLLSTPAMGACLTEVNGVVDGLNNRSDCLRGKEGLAEVFKVDRGRFTDPGFQTSIVDTIRVYRKADGDVVNVPGPTPAKWYLARKSDLITVVYWDTTDDGEIDGWFRLRDHKSTARSSVVLR